MVDILFKDGTGITAEVNGNSYIVGHRFVIPKDLSIVQITGEEERTIRNAQINEVYSIDGRFWFCITGSPDDNREMVQMRADIDYLAMEMGIDLEGA